MPTYRVSDKTTGIEWDADGKTRRVESGKTTDDIPEGSVADLLEQGVIEPVDESTENRHGGTLDERDTRPLTEVEK